MTTDECMEKWLIQIERTVCLIENEFLMLNEEHLDYRLHVHRCNIREIMHHLYFSNARLILALNQGIMVADTHEEKQEYTPGWTAGYLLSHIRLTRCPLSGRNKKPSPGISGIKVFYGLLEQQNKLKEFISFISRLDMNKKIVPSGIFGIIKLSLAETMDYVILYQKHHFILARYLLKIQQ
jgi:hypothetical protein